MQRYPRVKKWLLISMASVILVIGSLAVTYFILQTNIHTVISGRYYRSAQLDGQQFAGLIQKYHIKTIINLRGAFIHAHWYQREMAVSRHFHIKHHNLFLKGYNLPTAQQIKELVYLLQTAKLPVLVHCQGGADRTGFAAAVIMLLHNASYQQAMRQISYRYFSISPHSIGRLTLPYYRRWLVKNNLHSSRQHFLEWVDKVSLSGHLIS